MKMRLAIAASILFTLGTAVSATMSTEEPAAKPAAESSETASKQSAQIVALWKAHASSAASVPMARPL